MSDDLPAPRAWRCHAFGDYHDLAIAPVLPPAPAAGELLLRVRAFALGFPDMLMVQGLYQLKPPLPFTPGAECAGDVVALGAGVTQFTVGERVIATVRYGAAADYLVAPAEACRVLPAAFDYASGAAFTVGYKTAYVGLVVRGRLAAGETVLVHGAAGGVGLAAVELAHALGATVIAMASGPAKLALVRARGADHVIDYAAGRFREAVKDLTGGRGVDVVYDPVGGDVFDESLHCLAQFGRLLVIGFAGGRIAQAPTNYVLIKQLELIGVRAGEYGRQYPAGGRAVDTALAEWAASGRLTPHVHARLPFAGVIDAFDAIAARTVSGRIVIETAVH